MPRVIFRLVCTRAHAFQIQHQQGLPQFLLRIVPEHLPNITRSEPRPISTTETPLTPPSCTLLTIAVIMAKLRPREDIYMAPHPAQLFPWSIFLSNFTAVRATCSRIAKVAVGRVCASKFFAERSRGRLR